MQRRISSASRMQLSWRCVKRIRNRVNRETPSKTARKLLAKHGLSIKPGHTPVPQSAYHDLDHDLIGEGER